MQTIKKIFLDKFKKLMKLNKNFFSYARTLMVKIFTRLFIKIHINEIKQKVMIVQKPNWTKNWKLKIETKLHWKKGITIVDYK